MDLRKFIPNDFKIDGKPIYKDKTHWNVYGANKIAEEFIKSGNIFINPKDLGQK